MSNFYDLFKINFQSLVINIFIVLVCLKYGWELIDWVLKKCGVEFKSKLEKKKLDDKIDETEKKIDQTNETIAEMQSEQANSIIQFNERDNEISERIDKIEASIENIMKITTDIKSSVEEIKTETRLNTSANIELLYQKINEKCDHYISIKGIPNEEYTVLENLFKIYNDEGGNHGLKRKVDYCLNKLPIIPDKQL